VGAECSPSIRIAFGMWNHAHRISVSSPNPSPRPTRRLNPAQRLLRRVSPERQGLQAATAPIADSERLVFASLVLAISRRSSAYGSRTVQTAAQLATGGAARWIDDSAGALGWHSGYRTGCGQSLAVPDLARAGGGLTDGIVPCWGTAWLGVLGLSAGGGRSYRDRCGSVCGWCRGRGGTWICAGAD